MKKIKKYRTDFLFSKTSFLIGAGSVFNLAGNYYKFNYSREDEDPDEKALMSDWGMVGQDLKHAIVEMNKISKPTN